MRLTTFNSTLSAFALFLIALTTTARADADLNEGLGRLAKEVAGLLQKEGAESVNVGDFIAPPRLQASGGAGLSLQIAESLKQHQVTVSPKAKYQLIGQFKLRDEKADKADGFESVALRIEASLLNGDDDEVGKLKISVFGDAALQFVGGNTELPENLPPPAREEKKREAIENPHTTIVGDETRTSGNSPFGIEVRVRQGQTKNSTPRQPTDDGGRAFVKLDKGEEYIVRLHNRAPFEAAVTLSVDGLSMFAFSSEGNFGSQILVPSGKFVDIPGWYITKKQTDAFEITSYAQSAAASRGVPITKIGTITATFHEAVAGSGKDPNATGRGRQIDQEYVEEKRVVKNAIDVISVRYNR